MFLSSTSSGSAWFIKSVSCLSKIPDRGRWDGGVFVWRKLDVCGDGMKNQKSSCTEEKTRFKWETKTDKLSWKTAGRQQSVLSTWPSVPGVWKIPLMLKEVLKSVGSCVDKLRTCAEYQCLAAWAEYTTAAHLYRFIQSEATKFWIHFCNSTHLDPGNQLSLIIKVQTQFNSFISRVPGSSLSPRWHPVAAIPERWSCLILQRCLWLQTQRNTTNAFLDFFLTSYQPPPADSGHE